MWKHYALAFITISSSFFHLSLQKAGIKVKDWVLAINGIDVRYKSHDDVVAMVKECKEEVTLEVTTPEPASASEDAVHSKENLVS